MFAKKETRPKYKAIPTTIVTSGWHFVAEGREQNFPCEHFYVFNAGPQNTENKFQRKQIRI